MNLKKNDVNTYIKVQRYCVKCGYSFTMNHFNENLGSNKGAKGVVEIVA
jgi:hypothetical protein